MYRNIQPKDEGIKSRCIGIYNLKMQG